MFRIISLAFILTLVSSQVYGEIGLEAKKKAAGEVAIMLRAIKKVDYRSGNKDWTKAKRGLRLNSGDGVKTGKRSTSIIRFLDGSIVRVKPKSEVEIQGKKSKKSKRMEKTVHLSFGNLGFKVKRRPGEAFRFSSPTAVASIKGTDGDFLSDFQKSVLKIFKSSLTGGQAAAFFQALKGDKKGVDVYVGEMVTITKDGKITKEKISPEEMKKQLEGDDDGKDDGIIIKFKTKEGMQEVEVK